MLSNSVIIAIVLSCVAYSGAFVAPLRHASSLIARAAASDAEYDTLISNVRKNTPPGSVIVIKYGGHAMENEELKRFFCEDIAALCSVSITHLQFRFLLLFFCSMFPRCSIIFYHVGASSSLFITSQ